VLFERHVLPHAFAAPMIAAEAGIGAMTLGIAFAAVSGRGLIAPTFAHLGSLTGVGAASRIAARLAPGERGLVGFLSERRRRLFEVIAAEACCHLLLAAEIAVVFRSLAVSGRWADPLVFEGAAKFVSAVFFFVPGQVGAQEGVYTFLATALGLPAAAGLTLALARRIRAIIIGAAGMAMTFTLRR
jgi:hypothetical protein